MSELTHTAGPWAAKKLSGSYAEPGWVVLWPDKSKPGLHMRRIDWQGQMTEADAKLVAAAPELLQALRDAHKALDAIADEMTVGERYTNAGQYLIDSLPTARAAIAKAIEGTP